MRINLSKNLIAFGIAATLLSGCSVMSGRETAGEYVDDATITTSVKTQIIQDPILKAYQIHVETFQNTVQLSGFVDTKREIEHASRIAKNTKGVHSVKNNLAIR